MSFWKREQTFAAPETVPVRVLGVPPASDLISLGWNEKTITETHPRTGAISVREVEYELLCHQKHRSQYYIRWGRNGAIESLQATVGGEDKVGHLGEVRGLNRPSGRHLPAADDRVISLENFAG